jgi:hypothetical protein
MAGGWGVEKFPNPGISGAEIFLCDVETQSICDDLQIFLVI